MGCSRLAAHDEVLCMLCIVWFQDFKNKHETKGLGKWPTFQYRTGISLSVNNRINFQLTVNVDI